jgi:acyl-CoA thioesterase II
MSAMGDEADPLVAFTSFLSVEPVDDGEYTARLVDFGGRSFGGDLLARAVLAASATAVDRRLHSLHACFLRPLPPAVPIRLVVERLKDGRRFAQRRVQARLDGQLMAEVTASFAASGDGLTYQSGGVPPDLPAPDDLPSTHELARAEGWAEYAGGPIEYRRIGAWMPELAASQAASKRAWMMPRRPLPDTPALHAAALAYLSDFLSHWGVEMKLGPAFVFDRLASLDHALWVHRPLRWDDWWLVTTLTEVAHAGRALTRREVHSRDGVLVASIAQETLVS